MTTPSKLPQMIRNVGDAPREVRAERIECDLVVVGGGLAGVCAAIAAAREGLRVTLVQDRPVLGGNASSEVRLWTLGATSHMGNNNRWAREGGVMGEIYVENNYRNTDGNPYIFDALLLEMVRREPNIRLLLNTTVNQVCKSTSDRIEAVEGYCGQNETRYRLQAPLFCDASGDGVVGFLAGAAFRMGAESREEFGEKLAPDQDYGFLLGHSIYFYSKDVGRPVKFVPPSFALDDITKIPRYRRFRANQAGCNLWWLEYGGRLDTIHDTEEIKWELWKIVYGVWNHIKNSGEFPEAETLTLEWVGTIPGKRESRRFEGDYMLTQQDLIEQRRFDDAVSFGGWSIDLHPSDGVYSDRPPCNQWHSKGVFQIPYRALYSRNIENLFLGGRLISSSHIAFGATRVMATCGHNGQAVGVAAAVCHEQQKLPKELLEASSLQQLQQRLLKTGHYIPHVARRHPDDLAQRAHISATSRLQLEQLPANGQYQPLTRSRGILLPLTAGCPPRFTISVIAQQATELVCELRGSQKLGNFTPEVILATQKVQVEGPVTATAVSIPHGQLAMVKSRAGVGVARTNGHEAAASSDIDAQPREIELDFDCQIDSDQYVLLCVRQNPLVSVAVSDHLLTGVVSIQHGGDRRVAEDDSQTPEEGLGIEALEFWCPQRRPHGKNLAFAVSSPINAYSPEQVTNGISRPVERSNAWVADPQDPTPRLSLKWETPQTVRKVELTFDTDWDHAMETVLMVHPESVMPHCVQKLRLLNEHGQVLADITDNYQTKRTIVLDPPQEVRELHFEVTHPSELAPAALFEVACY